MASVITMAFEGWKAQEAASGKPVLLNEFVFANVPNLDPTKPIDRNEKLPPANQIVCRQAVNKAGLASENAVAYSVTLGADVGDFDFNWIGLLNKESGTVAMITHAPLQKKLKTQNGQQGNVLIRSFLLEFQGAAVETQIKTSAETWQIDFTARLAGIDEMQRLINLDSYGAAAFFDESFEVTRSGEQFTVKKGLGYVGGLRGELAQNQILNSLRNTKVYADFSYQGNIVSQWNTVVKITAAATLSNYVDTAGFTHQVFAIASIDSNGNVKDLRPQGALSGQELAALETRFKLDLMKKVDKENITHQTGNRTDLVASQLMVTNELGKRQVVGNYADKSAALNKFADGQIRIGSGVPDETASKKDSVLVVRNISGESDRHAFRDESILDGITDYGGYGTFDSAVIFRGENFYGHNWGYQDRMRYQGSGGLKMQGGFLSIPDYTGIGVVYERNAFRVQEYNGKSVVNVQIGLKIDSLDKAEKNYSIVSDGPKAPMIHAGPICTGYPKAAPDFSKQHLYAGTNLTGSEQIVYAVEGSANIACTISYKAYRTKLQTLSDTVIDDVIGHDVISGGKAPNSTVKRCVGFNVGNMIIGESNRAYQSILNKVDGLNNFQLFMAGTAPNWINGNVGFGDDANSRTPRARVDVQGGDGISPAIRLRKGALLNEILPGAIESDGNDIYFTVGDTVGSPNTKRQRILGDKMGVNQSWVDVKLEREFNVIYTNTTNKPISVNVVQFGQQTQNRTLKVFVNEVLIIDDAISDSVATRMSASFIVPPTHNYRVDVTGTSIISTWAELR